MATPVIIIPYKKQFANLMAEFMPNGKVPPENKNVQKVHYSFFIFDDFLYMYFQHKMAVDIGRKNSYTTHNTNGL